MSKHDLDLANDTGANFRADANAALQALGSQQSGTSDPTTMYPYERQARTDTGVINRRNAANSGWLLADTLAEAFVIARTSNTVLTLANHMCTINVTSGTFTQTFSAVSGLPDNWWVGYRNSGTGVITLDPNSSELIDGATSITLNPGESCIIQSSGSAFITIGRARSVVRPAFSAAINAATSMTQNTFVKMAFNAEDFDTNSDYDATTNYRFTCSIAGNYQINLLATLSAISDEKNWIVAIYKNGSLFKQNGGQINGSGGAAEIASDMSVVVNLAVGDYLEAYGYNTDVAQVLSTTTAKSNFSGFKID